MKRKLLIVSFTSGQKYTGGLQCSKRNAECIISVMGKENVIQYIIQPYETTRRFKTIIKRINDMFYGGMGGINSTKTKEIINIIQKENITDLFIDSSLLGLLAKRIKKIYPHINVISFFHNFEKKFVKESIIINRDFIRFYWYPLTAINEKAAMKYSDMTVALNHRDADALEKEYKRKIDRIIPITLPEKSIKHVEIPSTNNEALFLGSYFFGNVQGIKWFCKTVIPYVNIHLTIVGASMDKLKSEIPESDKITILSNVPKLNPYFEKADFVVLPILSGSGMKVKTAESLMYGKYILGTDEALMGYEVTSDQALRCNTAEEFINAINKINLKFKFNKPSWLLFKEKYSLKSSIDGFAKILNL